MHTKHLFKWLLIGFWWCFKFNEPALPVLEQNQQIEGDYLTSKTILLRQLSKYFRWTFNFFVMFRKISCIDAQVQTTGDIKWWFIFWLFENSHSITVTRHFLRDFSSVYKIIVQNITYIHVHPPIFGYKIRIRDEIVVCFCLFLLVCLFVWWW